MSLYYGYQETRLADFLPKLDGEQVIKTRFSFVRKPGLRFVSHLSPIYIAPQERRTAVLQIE